MKKILLFADIGGHEYQQYYHVGDEAMFLQTYYWYKQAHPSWQLSAFSWFKTHQDLDIREYHHLHWSKESYRYFPILVLKFFCWRLTGFSLYSKEEKDCIKAIQIHDRVHLTGGGNISSEFRQWLYYCFFIFLIAKFFKKEIILTSQTLGPFNMIDGFMAALFLNFPKLIALRSNTTPQSEFKHNGILVPQVHSMVDSAYSLYEEPGNSKVSAKKTNNWT